MSFTSLILIMSVLIIIHMLIGISLAIFDSDYSASISSVSAPDASSISSADAPSILPDGSVVFKGQEQPIDLSEEGGDAVTTTTVSPFQTLPVVLNYTLAPFQSDLAKVTIDVSSKIKSAVDSDPNLKILRGFLNSGNAQSLN